MVLMADRILIVDDEPTARHGLRRALQRQDYVIEEAADGREALETVDRFQPDLVLCDVKMPEMDGLSFLQTLNRQHTDPGRRPVVIMITAYGSERVAVEAMKAGAYDYLSKPYDLEELRLTVSHALDKIHLERENRSLRQRLATSDHGPMVGQSEPIQRVLTLIDKVAPTDVTVLLSGESGTGKELAAQAIHAASPRAEKAFVTMNCAAIPKSLVESELFGHEKGAFTGATSRRSGKFEMADGGTLFLDEIADMSLNTQAKILRVLEDQTVTRLGGKDLIRSDVRLISATNKDLQQEIEAGRFREDLYYRIKVVEIRMPALRQRIEDVPLLIDHFVRLFSARHQKAVKGIDPEAQRQLTLYHWPGNVRQLQNVMEQCVVLTDGDCIRTEHLPADIAGASTGAALPELGEVSFAEAKRQAVEQFERDLIERALKKTRGNVSQASRLLRMKRQFLQQKIKALGVKKETQ
jgi:two-component system response regulator AtoC/two-component system nitrogen regulation response regulator NtrX